jgi:hypothetical protein
LNLLLKRLFVLQIKFDCLIRFFWLASEDNSMADPLSRENGLDAFLIEVQRRAFVVPPAVLQGMPDAGRVRTLDMSAPFHATDMAAIAALSRTRVDMAELSRQLPAIVCIQSRIRGWLVRYPLRACRLARANTRAIREQEHDDGFEPFRMCAYGPLARAYLRNLAFVPEKIPEKIPSSPKIPGFIAARGGHKTVRRGRRGSGLKTAVLASLLGCGMAMPARDGLGAVPTGDPLRWPAGSVLASHGRAHG